MILFQKMIQKRMELIVSTVGTRILSILVSLWWNAQLSSIINNINANVPITTHKIIVATATILLNAGIAYAAGMFSAWTSETMAHDLRMGYANHFTALNLCEIENLNAGKQLSKLQNEINDAINYIRGPIFSVADDFIRFAGTFIWLMYLNPNLTLLANAPTVILMFYTVFSSKIIGKAAQQTGQANENLNGFTDTLIVMFPIIRLFDASALICNKYDIALKQWESASIKESRRRARLMSLSGAFSFAPLMLLFLIGGSQVIYGTLSLGTLYIFINLSGNVSGIMINMPDTIAGFRRFAVNMERLQPTILLIGRGGDIN